MTEIFLSASVPVIGRAYYETADPFLIQTAVREFLSVTLGRRRIVWGGHPAITPMVWAVCEDLGVKYANAVVLYQSKFFRDMFPEENERFGNVVYVEAVEGNREQSLLRMRNDMLSRADLEAAVFIGGMEGVLDEYALFAKFHPDASVLTVPAAGGAARKLATDLGVSGRALLDLDFTKLFHAGLKVPPDEKRNPKQ